MTDHHRNAPPDVPYRARGIGHYSARKCDQRLPGGFLCGRPVHNAGPRHATCGGCAAAKVQLAMAGTAA